MQFFVYPYTQKSRSAKALADALDGKRVLREGSSYKYDKNHLLINWGCGECPHPQALNAKIMDLIEKTRFFKRLDGTGLTPAYATTKDEAKKLGYPVFCRTTTQGHDGQGIVVADCDGQLVSAKLYVKGIDKTSEYRIHVGRDAHGAIEILGASKKVKKPVTAEMTNVPSDGRVWTGETTVFGDFIDANSIGFVPMPVQNTAVEVMKHFPELSFCALDVVFDNSTGKAYAIEGNSAPMATPQTTKAYATFLRKVAEQVTPLPEVVATPVPQPVVAEVAPAAPVSSLTLDDVLNSIFLGELTPTQVIKGYIQNVQK